MSEARKADQIIAEGVLAHEEAERCLAAVDTVKEYRLVAEQLRDQELQRSLRQLSGGHDPAQVLAQMARAITQKLIHAPTTGLKKISAEGREDLMHNARTLLGLPPTPDPAHEPRQEPPEGKSERRDTLSDQGTFPPLSSDSPEQTLQ